MSEILGLEPDQKPEPPSPEVAREIQRDTIQVALHDAWFNAVMGIACLSGAAALTWLDYQRFKDLAGPVPPRLAWHLGLFAVFALWSAVDAWRAYRRMGAADESGGLEPVDIPVAGTTIHPERHWLSLRSRQIILVLLSLALGYQWYSSRVGTTGPLVFRNASITTNTGFVEERMTVAVADGRVVFVGRAEDSIPSSLSGARHIDAKTALVSAATFDHLSASPADALRHTWVGQLYEGAPGDLIISTYAPFRGRNRTPVPRELLGAVVGGRYYTAAELQKK